MKAAVRAAGSGEGCRQQWGCALQMGQVLLEGMAMGPHAALPCSRRSPRLGVSCLAQGTPEMGSCSANATGWWGCPRQGWVTFLAAPSLGPRVVWGQWEGPVPCCGPSSSERAARMWNVQGGSCTSGPA